MQRFFYDVYDLKEQRYLLQSATANQIGNYFNNLRMPVGNYARRKNVYDGRYCFVLAGGEIFGRYKKPNEKNKMDPHLYEEWEQTTKQIRDKVEWTNYKGKGVRQLSLV